MAPGEPTAAGEPTAYARFIAGLPKAELHVHHVGSARPETVAALAARHPDAGVPQDLAALKDMTSRVIGRFVVASEVATREAYGDGPLVRYAARLVVPDATRAECAVLKAVAAHFVMNVGERLTQMATQRDIIAGLVDAYAADPTRLDVEEQGDFAAAGSDAGRLRVIVDQVASLSDLRAWSIARAWDLA